MRGVSILVPILLTGCSVGEAPTDAGDRMDVMIIPRDAGPPVDAGAPTDADPFSADGACGSAVIETDRLPGSLLFVFDRSGSMDAPPISGGTGPTRWEIAGGAINAVLAETPDETNVGMLLFPVGGSAMCEVTLGAGVPQVPVAPLTTSRAQIESALVPRPDGPATPIFAALRAGWDELDALGARGERGLILVTDGRENCDDRARDAVLEQAITERTVDGHLTFVIGLTQSDRDLSTLALNGGTARNETCLADCTTPDCILDSDEPCDNGTACTSFPEGESGGRVPGFCGCNDTTDCPAPMTCEPVGGGPLACVGVPNCCHYNAAQASFEADFRAALAAIRDRVLDPCVFDLPRGDNPETFDPRQVNVRVTLDGEEPVVLGRSSDPGVDSWDYVDDDHEVIVIQGALCEELGSRVSTVEIVLGCATILI